MGEPNVILDVMPLDERVLGFSNRWYRAAKERAVTHRLSDDIALRVVTAPYFLATKIEAFRGRGRGDFFGSHDLEDMVYVIDGRPSIIAEARTETNHLRDYLRIQFSELLASPDFLNALPGYLLPDPANQARITIVLDRMKEMSAL